MPKQQITDEEFDEAIWHLLETDIDRFGVQHLASIPNIWESISEFYNNDAILYIENERAEAEEKATK